MRNPWLSLIVLGAFTSASRLSAQDGGFLYAGKVFAGNSTETSWRLSAQRNITGPLGADGSLLLLPGARPADGSLIWRVD